MVIDEAYTSQTCSSCGALPETRPKGIAGLGIREWTCAYGVTHDRDVNAARNIVQRALNLLDASQLTTDSLHYATLALGHERPVGGIPAVSDHQVGKPKA